MFTNILDYLKSLPNQVIQELYQDPWSCQAIFRSLPSLSKHIVLRLVFVDFSSENHTIKNSSIMRTGSFSIPENNVSLSKFTSFSGFTVEMILLWAKSDGKKHFQVCFEHLIELSVCELISESAELSFGASVLSSKFPSMKGSSLVRLNPSFRQCLKNCLCESGVTSFYIEQKWWKKKRSHKHQKPTVQELDEYSNKCWEEILRLIIASVSPTSFFSERSEIEENSSPSLPVSIIQLLVDIGLLARESNDRLRITTSGFQFLLKDTFTQMWTILLSLIQSYQVSN